jgi:hypothetical protein
MQPIVEGNPIRVTSVITACHPEERSDEEPAVLALIQNVWEDDRLQRAVWF